MNFAIKAVMNLRILGFKPGKSMSIEELEKVAGNTIARAENLEEATLAIDSANWCFRKWGKINKAAAKFPEAFSFKDNRGRIKLIKVEDAVGDYWLTNGLQAKTKGINLIWYDKENPIMGVGYKRRAFHMFTDGEYSLKFSFWTYKTMKLFGKSCKVCDIVLDKDMRMILKNNLTKYHIYDDGKNVPVIYEKSYIASLSEREKPKIENAIATIESDILDTKRDHLGLARLSVYKEEVDLEVLLFFAMSSFLLYGNRFKQYRLGLMTSISITAGAMSSLNRNR